MILNDEDVTCHQDLFKPTSTHYDNNSESIDSWVDKLVIGEETNYSLHTYSHAEKDYLARANITLESERDLPKIELPLFSGQALVWPRFIEQFYTQIHCRPGITDTRRMDLLQSHLRGEASQLVRGLGYSGKNMCKHYRNLKNAFGHKIKVARAFLNTIISGLVVSSDDAYALQRFYMSIRDCVTTLQQLHYTPDLLSSDIVVKTASRIPYEKVARWNAHVRHVALKKEPNLIDLLHWLKDQVDADFNPHAVPMY